MVVLRNKGAFWKYVSLMLRSDLKVNCEYYVCIGKAMYKFGGRWWCKHMIIGACWCKSCCLRKHLGANIVVRESTWV